MKSLLLLSLLVTLALCDKKLNLEDIERDNNRAEISNSKKSIGPETLRAEESKYSSVKAEAGKAQQQYRTPAAPPQELGNQAGGEYTELPSYESFKYASQPQTYSQEKYPENEEAYLQQLPEQQQQQQQYYVEEGRSNSQGGYDALQQQQQQQQHQPHYQQQQEVLVGNQLQTVQQKAASQKYSDGYDDKGTYYVNIPMSQLLAYYQNYGFNIQAKSKNPDQQISIPVYMPLLPQNQVYTPSKVAYEPDVQYVPTYPKHTQAVFTKTAKSSAPVHATAASLPIQQHLPAATSHQQYSAPIEQIMYTNAYQQPQKYQQYYIAQQHPQQAQYTHAQQQQHQQVAYEQPAAAAYQDIYNTPATAYVQDNSIYEQQQQHQQQPQQQQYYVPAALAHQLMTQILQEAGLQGAADLGHQSIKDDTQEALNQDFTPPQYQAQKFHSSQEVTHLVPVTSESEAFQKPGYSSASVLTSSHPKTLLDSYVPSHVIHAQDSNRYRERPIKLESGFLPSKINFIRSYKKRKTE